MARIEELRTNLLMEKNRLLDQTQVVQSLRRSEQELEVELLAKDKVNQELVTKIATQAECHNAEVRTLYTEKLSPHFNFGHFRP